MDPAEQARLLLERASHRLSGGEIAVLKEVANGRHNALIEAMRDEDGRVVRVENDPFQRIVTEFAAYLQF